MFGKKFQKHSLTFLLKKTENTLHFNNLLANFFLAHSWPKYFGLLLLKAHIWILASTVVGLLQLNWVFELRRCLSSLGKKNKNWTQDFIIFHLQFEGILENIFFYIEMNNIEIFLHIIMIVYGRKIYDIVRYLSFLGLIVIRAGNFGTTQ
jgi:hypothetical protein